MEEKVVMMGDGGHWPRNYCRVDVPIASEELF
jgi:hypothetical protein